MALDTQRPWDGTPLSLPSQPCYGALHTEHMPASLPDSLLVPVAERLARGLLAHMAASEHPTSAMYGVVDEDADDIELGVSEGECPACTVHLHGAEAPPSLTACHVVELHVQEQQPECPPDTLRGAVHVADVEHGVLDGCDALHYRSMQDGARLAVPLPPLAVECDVDPAAEPLIPIVRPPPQEEDEEDEEEDEEHEREHDPVLGAVEEIVSVVKSSLPDMTHEDASIHLCRPSPARPLVAIIRYYMHLTWVGYLILFVALLSVASQGTAVLWLPSVDGLIAASWLMQTQTLFLLPCMALQLRFGGTAACAPLADLATWRLIAKASLAQVFWAAGFFAGIDHTTLFHAWAFNNIHSVILVAVAIGAEAFAAARKPGSPPQVSAGEKRGACVSIAGASLMLIACLQPANSSALWGDTLAATGSVGALVFLNTCKDLGQRIPLFCMLAPISALNSVFMGAGAVLFNGSSLSVSDNGLFGWLAADRIPIGLYLGGVVGFLGTVCCIFSLKSVSPVVVGSVQTMTPVLGTFFAVLIGVNSIPDFFTTVGGVVLLCGVFLVAEATRKRNIDIVLEPVR